MLSFEYEQSKRIHAETGTQDAWGSTPDVWDFRKDPSVVVEEALQNIEKLGYRKPVFLTVHL